MTCYNMIRFACLVASLVSSAAAFSVASTMATVPRPSTQLSMSSVPQESPFKWRDVLPPSPEDQLVMTGDIVALFVYSFLDHSLNEMYVSSVMSDLSQAKTLDPLGELTASQVPVWFDAVHTMVSSERLLSLIGLGEIEYSPAIATAGAASVALTTCWLLSGYLNQAFLFRNTVECSPSKAIWVTGKSWLGAACLMVAVAAGSDYLMGHYVDILHSPSLGGITKADADFVFDSLSVLLTWRFCVSWLLGSGKD